MVSDDGMDTFSKLYLALVYKLWWCNFANLLLIYTIKVFFLSLEQCFLCLLNERYLSAMFCESSVLAYSLYYCSNLSILILKSLIIILKHIWALLLSKVTQNSPCTYSEDFIDSDLNICFVLLCFFSNLFSFVLIFLILKCWNDINILYFIQRIISLYQITLTPFFAPFYNHLSYPVSH